MTNLNNYASQLAQIGQSLTAEGDLLLYGCNVGAGEMGQRFVESIARITQADVAASDDLTGSAALGGNWALETVSGNIEAQFLTTFGFAGLLLWQHLGYQREFQVVAGSETIGIWLVGRQQQ